MENYSNHSYPDSRDSSPRSREIDCETPSWDDQPPSATSSYKVKFMCSYGGKIQPRSHDHQLAYVGGDTKILAVDRNIKLSAFVSKLSSLCDTPNDAVCFKYQLPGEDLDALISVTNDEDLDHMMIEYDRLYRASAKPARLRLFLFPPNNSNSNPPASFGSDETKSERQWFVDALNSVQIGSPDGSSPTAPVTASPTNPDFLFGFDKGYSAVPVPKFPESVTLPTVPDSLVKKTLVGSEDRHVVGEPVISQVEIQRQIQELQRLQIAAGDEPTVFQRKSDEIANPRAYNGSDYYPHKVSETLAPAQGTSPVAMQAHMQFPAAYMPERHMNSGYYPVTAAQTGPEQPVYLISTSTGVYQASAHRPSTGPVGQAYYGVPQRMTPEVYRDAQLYNTAISAQQTQQAQQLQQAQQGQQLQQAQQAQQGQQLQQAQQAQQAQQLQQAQQAQQLQQAQQAHQAQQLQQAQQAKVGAYSEGFAQVGYDAVGRQVYYTAAGGVISSYQTVAPVAVDGRQGGGAVSGAMSQIQDGKVVVSMASPASAM